VDERDKRHAKQFEPPPWEQDAFETFNRLKIEREQEEALEEALLAVRAPFEETAAEDAVIEIEQLIANNDEADLEKPASDTRAVSTAELETMLIGLRIQEPTPTKNYRMIANAVSAFLLVGGIGFIVWAATMFSKVGPKAGATPTLASLLLMVWGFLLAGGAALLYKKYNL
jgi:hypothetical protein